MNDIIPIIFQAGHYGCYLQWVLNNFTHAGNGESINYPFCKYGGCYKSYGRSLKASVLTEDNLPKFVAINPTIPVNEILEQVTGKAILIEFNHSVVTSNLNNVFLKQYGGDLDECISNQFPLANIDTSNLFEVRDFFSESLFPVLEWDTSDVKSDRVLKIPYGDLIFKFENVLEQILEHCNTTLSRPIEEVLKNHNTMIQMQTQLSKDSNLIDFLAKFEERENARFPPMSTIIDEAYVQRYLEEVLNLKMKKTYEKFPQTVSALRSYCYPKDNDPKKWPLGIDWEEDDDEDFGKDF